MKHFLALAWIALSTSTAFADSEYFIENYDSLTVSIGWGHSAEGHRRGSRELEIECTTRRTELCSEWDDCDIVSVRNNSTVSFKFRGEKITIHCEDPHQPRGSYGHHRRGTVPPKDHRPRPAPAPLPAPSEEEIRNAQIERARNGVGGDYTPSSGGGFFRIESGSATISGSHFIQSEPYPVSWVFYCPPNSNVCEINQYKDVVDLGGDLGRYPKDQTERHRDTTLTIDLNDEGRTLILHDPAGEGDLTLRK